MKNKLLYALLSTVFFSCAISNNIKPTSELALGVKFPQKFSIKTIPQETEKISIKISGQDLKDPVERSITRSDAGKVIFKDLPLGEKTVDIKAFDLKDNLLAQGSTSVKIEGGKVTTAIVELQELLNKLQLQIQNYPDTAELTILELKKDNKKFFKEFNSDHIDLDSLPSGEYDLRMTVFNKNSVPLAHKKTKIQVDKDPKTVSLDAIKLPETSEITSDLIAAPKELFAVLNDVLIKVPDNKEPKYDNPILEVNDVIQPVIPIDRNKPLCVTQGDKIKISMNTSDANNDKVSIFWGLTTRNKDNSLSFKLLDESDNDLIYMVDAESGNHALGFLLTDKKSYVGPYSIYFNVCK